ncbi:MAG: kelch repeat-containing protein [Thermoplasmata archaeon]|nr:kelch repeat-containing protein [Thermoplasmata archaeon]
MLLESRRRRILVRRIAIALTPVCAVALLLFPAMPAAGLSSLGISTSTAVHPSAAATWTNLTSSLTTNPGYRATGGFAWDANLARGVLFGGYVQSYPGGPAYLTNDTWTYSGSWTNISARFSVAPSPRFIGEAMVYDAKDGYVLLFGGLSGYNSGLGDTWKFTHAGWKDLSAAVGLAPSPRFGPSVTYDTATQKVLLFGGCPYIGSSTCYNDTWTYSGGKWTNLSLSAGPSPRRGAQMAYDPVTKVVLLQGGVNGAGTGLSDSWLFQHGSWHKLNPKVVPPAHWLGVMTFDPARHVIIMFGGCITVGCGNDINGTWSFAFGQWTNLSGGLTHAPPTTGSTMGVYDPKTSSVIAFGGQTTSAGTLMNQTWSYG